MGGVGDDQCVNWRLVVLLCAVLGLMAGEAGDVAALLNPMPTPTVVRLGLSGEDRLSVGVKHQDADFAWERLRGSLDLRAFQDEHQELLVALSAARTWIDSDLHLPEVGAIPQRLDEVSGTVAYRRFLGGGALMGGSLRLGSSSDDVFANNSVYDVGAAAFARVPVRTRDAWILSLNYANDRARLNHIPVPGVLYQWMPEERFTLLVGFPVAFVTWKPVPQIAVDAFASAFGAARAGVTWIPFAPVPVVRLRAGWEWGSETFKRADREERDDQLIFRDMRLAAGLDVSPLRQLSVGLRAAWLFEREIFEGEGSTDDGDAVSLESGWMFGASLSARF